MHVTVLVAHRDVPIDGGCPGRPRRADRTMLIRNNTALWTLQILLAALYLFAGLFKVLAAAQSLGPQGPLPIWFLRVVGGLETLGALGLILPGLTGIWRGLTPIAAGCLIGIMIGAVITSVPLGLVPALLPIAAGILDAVVVVGRLEWLAPGAAVAGGAKAAR